MTNSQSAHPTLVNDMEQTQGVPAGASSAESPCQFAIDGGGNLYRRYSEPVCASCVPVMKLTDKWESARVADFNAGWNACRDAMLSAAPQAQPAQPVAEKPAAVVLQTFVGSEAYARLDRHIDAGTNLFLAPAAQSVEAEQATVVMHEPVAVVVTWRVPGGTETGVEWMDAPPPDGTKLYVSAQPVREPMSPEDERALFEAFFSKPSALTWNGRGYDCKDGWENSYAVSSFCAQWLAWQVRAGIGSKGGAESDVSGTGWVES